MVNVFSIETEYMFCISFQAAKQVGMMEMSSDSDVRGAFSAVVSSSQEEPNENAACTSNESLKRKDLSEKNRKRKHDKENQDCKDKEYYIPYTRNNEFAENG